MTASLPMYDWPDVRAATDRWWQGIAAYLRDEGIEDVPDRLDRDTPAGDQWGDPQLLFSQTCGYPLTHEFAGALTLLATPVYTVPGCDGPNYSSAIVVRRDSGFDNRETLRGACAAINGPDSLSGCLALRAVFCTAPGGDPFFAEVKVSGSHLGSMQAVALGKADVAAIDCVSFAHARRNDPGVTAQLRVIDRSSFMPGLPYVTSIARRPEEVGRICDALAKAVNDPLLATARASLFIEALEFLPLDAYLPVSQLDQACGPLVTGSVD